jgi:hypothetical protein
VRRAAAVLALSSLIASKAIADRPGDAPPLPPPDPGEYAIVEVATAQQLADACWNLESDTAIVIAPGVYDLAGVAFPNGVDGRLTVGRFGAPPISNLQIRGATGDPADVVLVGAGMLDPIVPFGIQIFTATDVTIADLSIRDVYYHAVAIQGDQGAERVRLYHLRLFDAGQQIVKGSGGGADDVTIEYSELFYTAGAVEHPEGSPPGSCYTNAIDAIGSARWIVRDNLVRDIRCANGELAGPAVLLWQGSSDSRVERNTFLDCSRGVSLGLVGAADHSGGIVSDNFFRWEAGASYEVDVPIYTTSPGSKVLHNTALTRGEYPSAIEVRFAGATGVVVRHNLLDAAITPRDGAAPTIAANSTAAVPAWFRDLPSGDLHLTAASAPVRDQVTRLADAVDDFDAVPRPATAVDLGADEYRNEIVFTDGFESGDTSAWPLP